MVAESLLLAGFGLSSIVFGGTLVLLGQHIDERTMLLPSEAAIRETAERFELLLSVTIAAMLVFLILAIGDRLGLPGLHYVAGGIASAHVLATAYVLGDWVQGMRGVTR